jgi:site-specific recombinase XerD
MASVPHMKRATRRAEVYARSEVEAILTAPRQPRDRVLLMTVYGCGLRISEATQLKTRLLFRFDARTASVLNPQPFLISFVAIHCIFCS